MECGTRIRSRPITGTLWPDPELKTSALRPTHFVPALLRRDYFLLFFGDGPYIYGPMLQGKKKRIGSGSHHVKESIK